MPSTPIYELPFEQSPGDEPGHTLDGGQSGDEPILAEAVETELERIDTDVSDLQDEVALGWRPIDSGTESSENTFVIDITRSGEFPAGTFDLIHLVMRGSLVGGAGGVNLQINSDDSVAHRFSYSVIQLNNWTVDESGDSNTAISWRLAQWSTGINNYLECMLYHTHESSLLSYDATGFRSSGNEALRHKTFSAGDLASGRLVNSLEMRSIGADFGSVAWWVTGYRSR